ncbi:hypothetical protein ENH_00029100 [Eimeria necatrix]|uniref:Uncharacterized protein n=1 Tax=Eimeria necatrix TaxID=51315 RepID=U6MSI9_9EIME|nr:hypothetical protein ENH_00029100 [Eimeria necatrix]CDJ66996.1 hypothetical protein ENH_00029100 [Eimeria necatrix]
MQQVKFKYKKIKRKEERKQKGHWGAPWELGKQVLLLFLRLRCCCANFPRNKSFFSFYKFNYYFQNIKQLFNLSSAAGGRRSHPQQQQQQQQRARWPPCFWSGAVRLAAASGVFWSAFLFSFRFLEY